MVLVTLPVIPMRLYGVGLFPFKQLSHLWAGIGDQSTGSSDIGSSDQGQRSASLMKPDAELTSLDGAAQKLLVAINKNPNEPSLHNQLGLIYEGLGDNDKAIRQFQTAVDLSRSGLLTLSASQKLFRQQLENDKLSLSMIESARLSTDLSAAHSSLARIYDGLGMRDRVVSELDMLNRDRAFGNTTAQKMPEKTIASTQAQTSIHRLSPACLQMLARAQALSQAGRKGEAVQLYKQVLTLDPQAAIAHQQLGMTAASNGNYYLAKEELMRASELDPMNAATHITLGITYRGISQFDMARSEFQKAVQLDPRNYGALFQLGSMYASAGKNDLAAQTFQRVVELNPGSAAAHNNLGSSLSMTGKYRDAIGEFEKALALSPNMASSHYGMGMAMYNMKEYPAAIAELKQAVSLNPNYADAKTKIQLAYRHTNSGAMGGAL